MKVDMATVLELRRKGELDKFNRHPERLATTVGIQPNRFRQFCKMKGIKGKGKKKMRRAIRERELRKASANVALPNNPLLEGLVNVATNPRS